MHLTRAHAAGVARYLGLTGGRIDLPGDLVVVSPHLDDAVFSLGAAIAAATRRGRAVTVLTVLAGDPSSSEPAGAWDARAGFRTAGEAAAARRVEDERACALVGARPEWLPFDDHQYEQSADDDDIRGAVIDAIGDRRAVLPGFPLRHEDHHWVHALLADALPAERTGLYVEQPYAAAHSDRPGASRESTAQKAPPPAAWRFLRASTRDRLRKVRACRAYESQLPLLEIPLVRDVSKYEARVGGEAIVPRLQRD
jgi:LmbE family N-acetylglucosaminyl deacetylase